MLDLALIKICALLHDIGKPECWANRKPWSMHVDYGLKILEDCFGRDVALTAVRHHTGPSYAEFMRPETDTEKIISLADHIASGADRPKDEEVRSGGPIPTLPVKLSHVLSDGSKIIYETPASNLSYFKEEFKAKFRGNEISMGLYNEVFDFLSQSIFTRIPADTRQPYNDVPLWDHSRLTAAIANCIYRQSGYKGDNPKSYRFALISCDADRVSSYINQSTRLADLRAGSNTVSYAIKEGADIIRKEMGVECVIFEGGGNFLALSTEKDVEPLAQAIKATLEETTNNQLTATVSHAVADGEEMQRNFGKVWMNAITNLHQDKLKRITKPPTSIAEDEQQCDVCGIRPAKHQDKSKVLPVDASPRPEALCEVCWDRREKGKGERSIDELKDGNNFVAILRADGDELGKILNGKKIAEFKKKVTPSRLAAISRTIHSICEKSFREIVQSANGITIYAGGDDLLAVLPGDRAFKVASEISKVFNKAMAEAATISSGVAIFNYKLPIYVGLEASQHLIENAKREPKKGSIDFDIIGGSGVTKDKLGKGPYTWDKFSELLWLADYLIKKEIATGNIRLIANAIGSRGYRYAQSIMGYQIARGIIPWSVGEKISHTESDLFLNAFLIYNAFRSRGV